MNDKQKAFVKEYLIDLNATQAAIRVGYSAKTAYSQGQRLLKHVEVSEALATAKEERSQRVQVDADWVLQKAVELHQRCVADDDKTNERQTLDLIGKHVDVGAYEERIRQDVNVVDRTEVIRRAREEVSGIFGERRAGDGSRDGGTSLPN